MAVKPYTREAVGLGGHEYLPLLGPWHWWVASGEPVWIYLTLSLRVFTSLQAYDTLYSPASSLTCLALGETFVHAQASSPSDHDRESLRIFPN